MSAVYIEAFSGLSGDMFLGALSGLLGDYDILETLPSKLHLPDAEVAINDVVKNGIACKHVKVVDKGSNNKSHGRHLSDILNIIDNAEISNRAKDIAKDIFNIIGKAESKIHNIPIGKIHFHEISGVDSIIDIVGSAVLIDELNITKTYSTAVCTGKGFVNTMHGKLPVPAPATLEILSGIPVYPGDETGERTTPTGAAILKFLNPVFEFGNIIPEKTAYGAGEKDFTTPNVLRISKIKEREEEKELFVIETNIDDMNNELLGVDFQDGLMKNGAIDFYLSNVLMKKGRQGTLVSCLAYKENIEKISEFIFENTSTLGVRYYPVERNILKREIKKVKTKFGEVSVKVVTTPSGRKRFSLEYEDLKKISNKTGIPANILEKELFKEIDID